MTTTKLIFALATVVLLTGSDWRQFRGTDNRNVSDEKGLPTEFGEGKNVAWKVPLPGRGPSSPIVVVGSVVVTCSSGPRHDRLHVLLFDAATGKLKWHRQLWATGHCVHDSFGAVATPTPASDGERIFAFYSSNDLACFDLDGNLLWFRGLAYDHPTTRNDVGMGSSPLVVGDTVIVQCQNQGESFAAGIDTATGETRWQIERERDAIWSSPTVLRGADGDDLVLLQSRSGLTAHDPQTGKEVWKYEARCHTIASVTTDGDMVYLPAEGLHALRCDRAAKSVSPKWIQPRLRSGNASPLVDRGRIYTINSARVLVCSNAADGSVLWELRLKGLRRIWASHVLADGHIYVTSYDDGLIQVIKPGAEKGALVGTTQLDSDLLATPAVANGAIYFRSDKHLWKVAFGAIQE